MSISIKDIQKLRSLSGAGLMDCKNALKEAKGDLEKAQKILGKKGAKLLTEKQARKAREGVIGSYVHNNGKVASLIQVYCETDFVARNKDFLNLVHNLAMQVVASSPLYVKSEDISKRELAKQKKIILEDLENERKPKEILDKIVEGKLRKYKEEISLLSQPFFKDPKKTMADLISEATLKLGEKIEIGEFVRLEL